MKKQILALLLILIIVGVAGCAIPTEKPAQVSEEVAVGEDIDEITTIEENLDTSSMDDLDQDLAEINW